MEREQLATGRVVRLADYRAADDRRRERPNAVFEPFVRRPTLSTREVEHRRRMLSHLKTAGVRDR